MDGNVQQETKQYNLLVSSISAGIPSTTSLMAYCNEPLIKDKLIPITNVITKVLPNTTSGSLITQQELVENIVRFSENETLDSGEVIRSEIASLLNINVPSVQKVYTEQNDKGIIINTNANKSDNINKATIYFSQLNYMIQIGMLSKDNYPEYGIAPNKSGERISDLESISKVIDKGLHIFHHSRFSNPKELEQTRKDYLNMILLDMILGQKRRGGKNYSIAIETTLNNTSTLKLIPGIGDYDYLDNDLQEDEYELNDLIVDRTSLLSVLLNKYSQELKSIISPLTSVSDRYKDCISKIIYNNTDKENAAYLEKIIFENIEKICSFVRQNAASKVSEQNKVEQASTTAQLNLTIASKESEINAKYPINPRDIVDENSVPVVDEFVKVTESEEPVKALKPNGYATAALLGGLVSIICGIGFAVAFMILNG